MKIGLHIPQVGPAARHDVIGPFARGAEEAGFDSLWVFDHVVLQREQESKYPYSPDGKMGFNPQLDFLEPLTLLTYLSGITSRVDLGTSVLVVPMRHPVLHAKILATMDRLSGGRIILGAGVGWWRQEYEVLNVPFERRGKRMDEALQLMQSLWSDEWVDFRGEFYEAVDWTSNPKPAPGGIRLWLGGESRQQLERVGKFADGWLATAKSIATLDNDLRIARDAAEKAGRDPSRILVAIEGAGAIGSDNGAQMAEQLAALAARGVSHAICLVHPREVANAPDVIARFGADHLPGLHALGAGG